MRELYVRRPAMPPETKIRGELEQWEPVYERVVDRVRSGEDEDPQDRLWGVCETARELACLRSGLDPADPAIATDLHHAAEAGAFAFDLAVSGEGDVTASFLGGSLTFRRQGPANSLHLVNWCKVLYCALAAGSDDLVARLCDGDVLEAATRAPGILEVPPYLLPFSLTLAAFATGAPDAPTMLQATRDRWPDGDLYIDLVQKPIMDLVQVALDGAEAEYDGVLAEAVAGYRSAELKGWPNSPRVWVAFGLLGLREHIRRTRGWSTGVASEFLPPLRLAQP